MGDEHSRESGWIAWLSIGAMRAGQGTESSVAGRGHRVGRTIERVSGRETIRDQWTTEARLKVVANVVTRIANCAATPPSSGRLVFARAVNSHSVKGVDVAELEVPRHDVIVLVVRFDIRLGVQP